MDDLAQYYKILGLEPGASPEELKQAYRDLVKVWHPDRFAHDPPLQQKAQERLKEINNAYQKLRSLEGAPDSGPRQGPSQTTPPPNGSPEEPGSTPPRSDPSDTSGVPRHRYGTGIGLAMAGAALAGVLIYVVAMSNSKPGTPTVASTWYAEHVVNYLQQERSLTRAQAISILATAKAKGDPTVRRIVDLDEFLARETTAGASIAEPAATPMGSASPKPTDKVSGAGIYMYRDPRGVLHFSSDPANPWIGEVPAPRKPTPQTSRSSAKGKRVANKPEITPRSPNRSDVPVRPSSSAWAVPSGDCMSNCSDGYASESDNCKLTYGDDPDDADDFQICIQGAQDEYQSCRDECEEDEEEDEEGE